MVWHTVIIHARRSWVHVYVHVYRFRMQQKSGAYEPCFCRGYRFQREVAIFKFVRLVCKSVGGPRRCCKGDVCCSVLQCAADVRKDSVRCAQHGPRCAAQSASALVAPREGGGDADFTVRACCVFHRWHSLTQRTAILRDSFRHLRQADLPSGDVDGGHCCRQCSRSLQAGTGHNLATQC